MLRRAFSLLDTSAFNWHKIQAQRLPINGTHSPWSPSSDREAGNDVPVPPRLVAKVREALVDTKICTHLSALDLINTGRVTISDLSVVSSNSGAFDRGSILVNGHTLQELSHANYAMFKPSGVSSLVCPTTKDSFRSHIPFPSMHIGWSSPIERSTRGLLLLLNDMEIGHYLEKAHLTRKYFVSVNAYRPLAPAHIDRLRGSCALPFSRMEIIPHVIPDEKLPITSPPGSAYQFTIRTTDPRPDVIRSLFNSVGVSPGLVRLDALGKLSLSHFGLHAEGDLKVVPKVEVEGLISKYS